MNRFRARWGWLPGLSVLQAGVLLGALSCGAADPMAGGGPQIISFGTNVPEVTDGETVRFVAVLTDPGGVGNLVGGQLVSPDGAIRYGAFAAAQGSYALDLSWSQIVQAQTIAFASEEKRSFVGEFYNAAGKKTSMAIDVRLHCKGEPACEGRCVQAGNSCPASTDKLCVAGACQTGCYVGGAFYAPDDKSPDVLCKICLPAQTRTAFSDAPMFASCRPDLSCDANGHCIVPFARQTGPEVKDLLDVAAPSAMLQVAVGDMGRIVRSTDGGKTWTAADSTVTRLLFKVFALNDKDIYAVGTSDTILKSTDGGATWAKRGTGLPGTVISGVWASSNTDVWVAGEAGVFRSTDAGDTWTKLTTPALRFSAVWGSSAADVYVTTYNGQVLRTTNGGTTFSTLNTGAPGRLYGIWGSGPADIYAVGEAGAVVRTTTSGASWTKLTTSSATTTFRGVWGSGPNDVYVTAGGSQVWRTTNATNLLALDSFADSVILGVSGFSSSGVFFASRYGVLRKL